jgi:hypothetical protein
MSTVNDYRVRFLDSEGAVIEEMSVAAENLIGVTGHATELASKLRAADFCITLLPPKVLNSER